LSNIEPIRIVAGWTECSKSNCNLAFYRYVFGDRCYSISDKIQVCPLCIFEKKEQNGTLPKKDSDISGFVHHKGIECKPEASSL